MILASAAISLIVAGCSQPAWTRECQLRPVWVGPFILTEHIDSLESFMERFQLNIKCPNPLFYEPPREPCKMRNQGLE